MCRQLEIDFRKLDVNNDTKLTYEEEKSFYDMGKRFGHPDLMKQNWDKYDLNHDGTWSLKEYQNYGLELGDPLPECRSTSPFNRPVMSK